MKNIIITAALLVSLFCSPVMAGQEGTGAEWLTVTSGTNITLQLTDSTFAPLRGYVDDILIDAPATATANVSVVWTPSYAGLSSVTLAQVTNCTADFTVRPFVSPTLATGAGTVTTNTSSRFPLVGGTVSLVVTNLSASNKTWSALVRFEK